MRKVISMYRKPSVHPLRETENLFWIFVSIGVIWTILHLFQYRLVAIVSIGFLVISGLLLACFVLLNRIWIKLNQ